MKIAVVCPVKNEAQFIGYSIMSAHPFVEEFIYAVAPSSDDGTIDILRYIADKYGKVTLLIDDQYDFDPMDMKAYNQSFNDCIAKSHSDAVWFYHPDMVVTKGAEITDRTPLAWYTTVTSYANDLETVITKGRADQWKNIHAKRFGVHYYGGYGSVNEDFYHKDVTGTSYRHYGTQFEKYPFQVMNSGIKVNHYCELKGYKRRLEKMKRCLKTQHPDFEDKLIEDMASHHPRVTLEDSSRQFGLFEFEKSPYPIPEVFTKYRAEFEPLMKEKVLV